MAQREIAAKGKELSFLTCELVCFLTSHRNINLVQEYCALSNQVESAWSQASGLCSCSVYVRIYIRIYIYTNRDIGVYIYICICIHMYICMQKCIQMYMCLISATTHFGSVIAKWALIWIIESWDIKFH